MTVLVLGANGCVGQTIAEREAENDHVVGTYRKNDEVTQRLNNNKNITMIQKNFFESTDTSDVVEEARKHGTINKVYWLVGESWDISWHDGKTEDFSMAVQLNALPLVDLILQLKPELEDETNFMRWCADCGNSAHITTGGPNKPASGGAKSLGAWYMTSAAAFYALTGNMFNTIHQGGARRIKNFHVGCTGDELEEIRANGIPLNGEVESSDIAEVMLWLNSETNVHMTGQTIRVDGGRALRTKHNVKDPSYRPHNGYY